MTRGSGLAAEDGAEDIAETAGQLARAALRLAAENLAENIAEAAATGAATRAGRCLSAQDLPENVLKASHAAGTLAGPKASTVAHGGVDHLSEN